MAGFDQNDDQNNDPGGGGNYDPYAEKRGTVGTWYKNYLGREGSYNELNGWAMNPNFGGVQQQIMNSPEGKAFAAKNTASTTPTSPFNGKSYDEARDAWMSGKYGSGEDAARRWSADFGVTYNGGDTITLPNGGGSIDIMSNFAGGRGNGRPVGNTWSPAGGNGSNPNGVSSYSGSISGPVGLNSPQLGGQWDQLYKMLLDRAQQGTNVDRFNPNIRQQADAFSANTDRSARNYLADQAEKLGPLANIQGEARLASEHAGQENATFEGQLIGREIQSKRDEIQQALSQMGDMLTEQQRMALQKELAVMNDTLSRYGIDVGAQTSSDRLGYDVGRSDMDFWLRSNGL